MLHYLSNKSGAPDQPPTNPTGPDHPTDEQDWPLKLAPTPEDTTPVVTYFYSTVGDKIRQTVTRVPFRHSWEVKRGDGWEPCGYTPCIDFSRRADFTAWAKTHKEVNPSAQGRQPCPRPRLQCLASRKPGHDTRGWDSGYPILST